MLVNINNVMKKQKFVIHLRNIFSRLLKLKKHVNLEIKRKCFDVKRLRKVSVTKVFSIIFRIYVSVKQTKLIQVPIKVS